MKKQLTRSGYLAQERTHLANERTLLAYWRTALAFLVLGAFLIKFIPSVHSVPLAVISILFGAALFAFGSARFFMYKEKINRR